MPNFLRQKWEAVDQVDYYEPYQPTQEDIETIYRVIQNLPDYLSDAVHDMVVGII